ncbi:TonB-dependent receptor [Halosquirtibacter xylanolyticus]|uniref:TonB-dependent receptor n=1 Tax=Halosquirtibacter xylanolyticus TaxID=3374599 RepID=UPI003749A961|nr:TonB-dependent receptor [Prolixibacteraceae bacterium]
MKLFKILLCGILMCTISLGNLYADTKKSPANSISGAVTCENQAIPFVNIFISGTTIGSASDVNGKYKLQNLPEGQHTIVCKAVGYKPITKEINIKKGTSIVLNLDMKEDHIGLDQVVISANRNETNRKEAAVIVNTINPKLFTQTSAVTLSEGLNFSPGVRMETDCQNCGFTQVRMNGMEGAYSQILINGRSIFSGLAAVYGLELIPTNMIERVEVVRGGGSALYGSSAIAGTINMITKDPIDNTFQVSTTYNNIGTGTGETPANDFNVNFNASMVTDNNKAGISLFGFYRDKGAYDSNGDGFSEVAELKNKTIGFRSFYKTGMRSKLTLDYFHINEDRRGGDQLDKPEVESNIAESVQHQLNTVTSEWKLFTGNNGVLNIYGSMQHINRDSYYGANQDPAAFGNTTDLAYNIGTQFNQKFELGYFDSDITVGVEHTGDKLSDNKIDKTDPRAPKETNITDQSLNIFGTFAQWELKTSRATLSLGARYDHYNITDKEEKGNTVPSGNVLSPRISLKYDITKWSQLRGSVSTGYRAPQVFNEDLHIEVSQARKVVHVNDANLKQESSVSYTGSYSITPDIGEHNSLQFLVEGFYTKLNDTFVFDYGAPSPEGVVEYTRKNAKEGSVVKGVNLELNAALGRKLTLQSGYTIQRSYFKDPSENSIEGYKEYFRTPENYGYVTLAYSPVRDWTFAANGTYTGTMLVPYSGNTNPQDSEGNYITTVKKSPDFYDLGFKISKTWMLPGGISIILDGGVKNILNDYQSDFDKGGDRDSGYIYGPGQPRTVFFGLKIGNLL